MELTRAEKRYIRKDRRLTRKLLRRIKHEHRDKTRQVLLGRA